MMQSNLIRINVTDIPNHFKENNFYRTAIEVSETDIIEVDQQFINFNETVTNFNDIVRIMNLYKYWQVSDRMFFDLIFYNRHLIIDENVAFFDSAFNEFEMYEQFKILLDQLDERYSRMVERNYENLLEYMCFRNIIDYDFINNIFVKRMNFLKILKNYNYLVPWTNLVDYGTKNKNIEYLHFLLANYNDYDLYNLFEKCSEEKANNWIDYLMIHFKIKLDNDTENYRNENYIGKRIGYDVLYSFSTKKSGNGYLFMKLITENLVPSNTDEEIANLFFDCSCIKDSSYSYIKIIEWLVNNKRNLNYLFDDNFDWFRGDMYEIAESINDDWLEDLTVSRYLQLIVINNSNVELLGWLLNNGVSKEIGFINRSVVAFLNVDTLKSFYDYGYVFDKSTINYAIKSSDLKILKFVMDNGCNFNNIQYTRIQNNITYLYHLLLCGYHYKNYDIIGDQLLDFLLVKNNKIGLCLSIEIIKMFIMYSNEILTNFIFNKVYYRCKDIDTYIFKNKRENIIRAQLIDSYYHNFLVDVYSKRKCF